MEQDIFLFEFKLDQPASKALQQTKDKGYAEKYRLHGKTITLIGASFSYKERKVVDWDDELDKGN